MLHALTLAVVLIVTPAVALIIAPAIAFTTASSSIAWYLKDDFKQIFKTVLDFRPFATLPALAPIFHYKSLSERLLKAQFPDVY